MKFTTKTWTAREGVGLNKFSIDGGTPVELVCTPDQITKEGDSLSASNLNNLESRIASAINTLPVEITNTASRALTISGGNYNSDSESTVATYITGGIVATDKIKANGFIGDLNGNASSADKVEWDNVQNKPSTFPPADHNQAWSTITDKPSVYPPESHTHDYLPTSGGSVTNQDSIAINATGGNLYTESSGTITKDYNNVAIKVTGGIYASNGIEATKIFNAVWNDIADFIEIPDNFTIEYGKAYTRDKQGNVVLANNGKSLGIASDTYGFGVGNKEGKNQMPIAIGGWVLAYTDKIYDPMTPLKAGENGILTELLDTDRDYLCLGFFDRVELNEEWNGIKVKGRNWIKVK